MKHRSAQNEIEDQLRKYKCAADRSPPLLWIAIGSFLGAFIFSAISSLMGF